MSAAHARVLVVDNHDSFVHILVDYLRELGADVTVVEADEVTDAAAAVSAVDGVLVSPGPGTPSRAGASVEVVRAAAAGSVPLLGVCLGHQAVAEAFGAEVDHAPELMHGMASRIAHDGTGVFEGLPSPLQIGRYHSLAVVPASLPDELTATARTDTGVVMAVAHTRVPVWGVQFHPESVLTEGGHRMLANWLAATGMSDAPQRADALHPRV